VQVVDVLRTEKEAVAELRLKFRQGDVRGIGLGLGAVRTTSRIKLPDQRRIALPGLGGADIFDVVAGPQAIRGAKGR